MRFIGLLIIFFLGYSCDLDDTTGPELIRAGLTEITSVRIDVPEPSGLSLNAAGNRLWVVSDRTAKVYQITLDGRLLQTLSYVGEDLEGVSQSRTDLTLWVAEERKRQLVQLDTTGRELNRFKIKVENSDTNDNSGLEGVALHPLTNRPFVLNEKNPALFVTLHSNGTIEQTRVVTEVKDCSGLAIERGGRFFWLISDESRSVVKYDSLGSVAAVYPTGVDKGEGIAVSTADSLIYVVSDSEQKLYIFKMP